MAEKIEDKAATTAENAPVEESLPDEAEAQATPGWREVFREAFDRARKEHQAANRRDLGRDRSRSLFLLAGAAIAVLLLFLGVFSSSNTARKTAEAKRPGTPDLGRRVTPGRQATGQEGSVTPLLNAQTSQQEPEGNQAVTAEDVGRTARPSQPFAGVSPEPAAAAAAGSAGPYALSRIDFSDATSRPQASGVSTSSAGSASDDLKKPSLAFVRSVGSSPANGAARVAPASFVESPAALELPAGTKLLARLQSIVSSAIKAPVVAAIEYSYERDGQIVVPAGAQALGGLQQADRSGYVAIHFDTLQMPDGTTEKIDATAMSMTYGPLRGNVSGKKTGTRILVRAFTGLGTVATYLVGARGTSGFNGPLSESALLRDRIATNIGVAGEQELTNLAFNQNIVVTVPGNTRFYIVIQKGPASREGSIRPAATQQVSSTSPPTLQELRELMQLRRELSELYQQPGVQSPAQQVSQQ